MRVLISLVAGVSLIAMAAFSAQARNDSGGSLRRSAQPSSQTTQIIGTGAAIAGRKALGSVVGGTAGAVISSPIGAAITTTISPTKIGCGRPVEVCR